MNDESRAEWLDNDEGLYCWWKSTEQPKHKFIKEHRQQIDKVIENILTGKKPAHYLRYGD